MFCNCFGALNSCKGKGEPAEQTLEQVGETKSFSYSSLRSATGDFHSSCKIGGGGYGVVYKGVLRDGTQVAIKSLSVESKQGTHEFMTEIEMISNIQHPNLVKLIGFCIEGTHRILVYEFLENNSLASALLGSKSKCLSQTLFIEISKQATYCWMRTSIRKSVILVLQNFFLTMSPMLVLELQEQSYLFCLNRGYLAPEYALLRQLTKKADVYSFGILMLEIISGKSSSKAAFGDNILVLVEWAWKLKEENRLLELVDSELTDYDENEVYRFLVVALFCTQSSAKHRPTMKQVLQMLSKQVHLNEKALTEPGIYRWDTSGKTSGYLNETSSSSHVIKYKRSENQHQTSTQFSGTDIVTEMFPR
ncbi:hypothetical protein KIW84_034226 [Lathyrus oleraceus]|uniref:Protein kinase domain-containing protein n=1 Tax=Pisum sativum TaxID=3888 RepID=A0A9D5B0Y4_PEA|nr:hypothetical protein KIW84_034226 [Pisum sativum]